MIIKRKANKVVPGTVLMRTKKVEDYGLQSVRKLMLIQRDDKELYRMILSGEISLSRAYQRLKKAGISVTAKSSKIRQEKP